jgi:hypothetical protein
MLELSEDRALTIDECKYIIVRLCESLSDALRVADSRGRRLPTPDCEDDDEDGNEDEGGSSDD